MGSKKTRNKEKDELKKVQEEEEVKKVKKRKVKAVVNIITACSLLLFLWVSNMMTDSIGTTSKTESINANLKKQLELKNPVSKGIVDCDDTLYVLYENNDTSGLATATRTKVHFNRFEFNKEANTPNNTFTLPVNYKIHNTENGEKTFIVLYGNILDTKITNVEVSYNGKTELVAIESPTHDYFITTLEVPASEKITSVDLKLFNNRDDDVTEQFTNK